VWGAGGRGHGAALDELRVDAVADAARAGNRRFWLLSALRAHTKMPYKTDLYRKTLRALKRPGRPGQDGEGGDDDAAELREGEVRA
jgi:hypothetical protein